MSHDPLCTMHKDDATRCYDCRLIGSVRAAERERIAVQLEEWADDPTSEQPPARSMSFTLTMAARAIRRWGTP